MKLLFLIRHGHNEYVGKGKLAGRMPGIHLSELGTHQAACLAKLLKPVRLQAVYASPLERTMETATPIAAAQGKDRPAASRATGDRLRKLAGGLAQGAPPPQTLARDPGQALHGTLPWR